MSEIWPNMYFGLHANYTLLPCDFNVFSIFSTDVRKIHVKFHDNPSCGSRGVPWKNGENKHDRFLIKFLIFYNNNNNNNNNIYSTAIGLEHGGRGL